MLHNFIKKNFTNAYAVMYWLLVFMVLIISLLTFIKLWYKFSVIDKILNPTLSMRTVNWVKVCKLCYCLLLRLMFFCARAMNSCCSYKWTICRHSICHHQPFRSLLCCVCLLIVSWLSVAMFSDICNLPYTISFVVDGPKFMVLDDVPQM